MTTRHSGVLVRFSCALQRLVHRPCPPASSASNTGLIPISTVVHPTVSEPQAGNCRQSLAQRDCHFTRVKPAPRRRDLIDRPRICSPNYLRGLGAYGIHHRPLTFLPASDQPLASRPAVVSSGDRHVGRRQVYAAPARRTQVPVNEFPNPVLVGLCLRRSATHHFVRTRVDQQQAYTAP